MATFPEELTNAFEVKNHINGGAYGTIYRVIKRSNFYSGDQKMYAMKAVVRENAGSSWKDIETELQVLSWVSPYKLHLDSFFVDENTFFMIIDYCRGGDLLKAIADKIHIHELFEEDEIWKYFIQICFGLESLHYNGFIHRDLHPQNILLDENNDIKIADFGISRSLPTKKVQGVLAYQSPRTHSGDTQTKESDVWAVGCILYYLCNLEHPFGDNVSKIKNESHKPIRSEYSNDLRYFIDWCLKKKRMERPTIFDILTHEFIVNKTQSLGITIPQTSAMNAAIWKIQLNKERERNEKLEKELSEYRKKSMAQKKEIRPPETEIAPLSSLINCKNMNTIKCYDPECDREVELSCNCTSPDTYSCKKHLMEHCKSSNKPHNFISLFVEPVKGTKEAILALFAKEKSKIEEIKASITASFSQTLCSYENILEQVLNEIDSDSTKIGSYIEKISQAQKLSKLERDPALNLLTLQPSEAVEKAKVIFTTSSNKNIKLFYDKGIKIDAILKSFHAEKSKVISHEIDLKNTLLEDMNFESEEENIQVSLKEYKEAIRIDPNDEFAYKGIGDIFYNEKRYEEAVKYFDNVIRINPNDAEYYGNKGEALRLLSRREEAMECFKEAFRIDPNRDGHYNSVGLILFDEKKYEEAVKYYNDAIRIDPEIPDYHTNKGDALWGLHRREEAMECYKEAIRIDSYYDMAYFGIGNIFSDEKNYEEAVKYYNDAIKICEYNAKYYINKGNALGFLNKLDEAMECYKEAIKIDPDSADAYSGIGDIFYADMHFEFAVNHYNNAIRINPNNPKYYLNKGHALYVLEKIKEAMKCYKEAIRIDANNASTYFDIGNKLYYKFRYEEAIKYYNDAIRINANDAKYYTNKGKALIELNRREEVIECYKEVIRIDPNNSDAYNGIGGIFYNEKRYEEAVNYYIDAIRINPNSALYCYNKGLALRKLGRREEAVECYKEAIRIDQNYDDAYNNIGNILFHEKRYEEAVKYFDDAIRVNPNSVMYFTNKGETLDELGRREEAMECYKEAIRIDPDDAETYNDIGDIFYNKERYEEAVNYYNDAIRIDPNDAKYYKNKGNALYELGRIEEAMDCFNQAKNL